jgi:hypothetical protein
MTKLETKGISTLKTSSLPNLFGKGTTLVVPLVSPNGAALAAEGQLARVTAETISEPVSRLTVSRFMVPRFIV